MRIHGHHNGPSAAGKGRLAVIDTKAYTNHRGSVPPYMGNGSEAEVVN